MCFLRFLRASQKTQKTKELGFGFLSFLRILIESELNVFSEISASVVENSENEGAWVWFS